MARVGKGQLNIPVPSRIGFHKTPDELFREEYGTEAFDEQVRRYEEERRCTCTPPDDPDKPYFPSKWGVKYGHKAPCPRAVGRF